MNKVAGGSKNEKGVFEMLDSVTKKWEDQSTIKAFKFVFYCDCCGKRKENRAAQIRFKRQSCFN